MDVGWGWQVSILLIIFTGHCLALFLMAKPSRARPILTSDKVCPTS